MRSPRYTILIANRNTGVVRRLTVVAPPLIVVVLRRSWACPAVLLGPGRPRRRPGSRSKSLRTANDSLQVENESYRAATGELADADFVAADGADAAERAGAARSGDARRRSRSCRRVMRSRAMGGGDAADASRRAPTRGRRRRRARSACCKDLLGVLEDRLDVGEDEGRKPAGARARDAVDLADRRLALVGLRQPHGSVHRRAGLPPRPRHLRRPGHAGPRHRRRHGRVGRATTATTATAIVIDARLRHRHALRPPVRLRRRASARRSSAATSSATSARPAAPPAPHLHYEILLNGQPINPLQARSAKPLGTASARASRPSHVRCLQSALTLTCSGFPRIVRISLSLGRVRSRVRRS